VAKKEELAKEMMNLAFLGIFVHTSKGFLTCREERTTWGREFASAPKEVVLRIFIALKNPPPSARFQTFLR
jgi:hypothetical protein